MRINKVAQDYKTPPYVPTNIDTKPNFKGKVNYSHFKIGNMEQIYFNDKMLQICDNGNEVTYTTVDTITGKIIKKVTKYLCNKCEEMDCEWCRKYFDKFLNEGK